MVAETTQSLNQGFRRLLWMNTLAVSLISTALLVYFKSDISSEYFAIPVVIFAIALLVLANRYSVNRAKAGIAHTIEELNEQISTDVLTGVTNRRAGMTRLNQEVGRSRRAGAMLTIAMVDADNFKHLNDTYGHLAGDRVLKVIASTIHSHLRTNDVVFRYGGEEFVIVMPDTDEIASLIPLERLRKRLASLTIQFDDFKIKTSVSIGVAAHLDSEDDIESLLGRADEALYKAKHKGKNRIELYRSEQPETARVALISN